MFAPLGDVADRAEETDRAPLIVPLHTESAVGEPDNAAVGGEDPVLRDPRLTGLPGVSAGGEHLVAIVGMDHREPDHRIVDPRLGGDAEHVAELRAHVLDRDVRRIPRSEHVAVLDRRAPLDQCAEAVLGRSRLLLGFMQRRDVHHHAFEQQRLAARVPPLQHGVVDDPDHPAVLGQVPVLHLERHAFIDASLGGLVHARVVVRVHASSPTAVGPLGLRVAEHLRDLRRDERGERAVLGRPHLPQIDDRRNVGEDVSELLLGVRALLFRALSLGDLDAHQLVRLLQRGRARAYAELELVVCGGKRQLRLLLDGDVDHHPLPAGGVAVDVSKEHGVVAQPDNLSLGADHPVLALPRVAGARREVVRRELTLAIVGMQDLDPHVRLIEPFLHRVAEQVLDHAVHVARAAFVVGVGLVDDGREFSNSVSYWIVVRTLACSASTRALMSSSAPIQRPSSVSGSR